MSFILSENEGNDAADITGDDSDTEVPDVSLKASFLGHRVFLFPIPALKPSSFGTEEKRGGRLDEVLRENLNLAVSGY